MKWQRFSLLVGGGGRGRGRLGFSAHWLPRPLRTLAVGALPTTYDELTRNRTAGLRCVVVPSAGRTDGSFSTVVNVFVSGASCSAPSDTHTHTHARTLVLSRGLLDPVHRMKSDRTLGSAATATVIRCETTSRRGRRAFAVPSLRRADKRDRDRPARKRPQTPMDDRRRRWREQNCVPSTNARVSCCPLTVCSDRVGTAYYYGRWVRSHDESRDPRWLWWWWRWWWGRHARALFAWSCRGWRPRRWKPSLSWRRRSQRRVWRVRPRAWRSAAFLLFLVLFLWFLPRGIARDPRHGDDVRGG